MNPSEPDDASFQKLIDEFLEEYYRAFPHEATFLGIHKYDDRLDHVDLNTRREFLIKEASLLEKLGDLRKEGMLSADAFLDLEVLSAKLKYDITSGRIFDRFRNDPSVYPDTAVFSCLMLLLREFAPREQRLLSLISRMKEIPRFFIEAKDNLRQAEAIPGVWLDIAEHMTSSAQHFFSDVILNVSGEIESLKNDLLAAATLASKAFKDYLVYLQTELSRKPECNFAAGEEYFDFLLKEYHMLDYSRDEIEAIGLRYIGEAIDQIKTMAAEIDPRRDWIEIVEDIKSDTPAPEYLLDYYRGEMSRTREFVLDHDLVSFPDRESLEIIETPPMHRSIYPYAAYLMPAPFETDQRGFFWVTPIDMNAPDGKIQQQLSGHCKAAVAVKALHEGYPGHHIQLCRANGIRSKIRRIVSTSVFAEGWALYCEELMKEKGFYPDVRSIIIQLKDQLWRACRVVIDVRLHTGKFRFDEAVEMLVGTARLEEVSAEAEVRRYTQTPTQPMSYLIGRIEIERLYNDFRKKYPHVSLKDFHDRLLSYGTIPIRLVHEQLVGTN
ncbi:MAG: DUF885 domain-containing protein [Candidatus Zixiibacteriota bacterium]|nr:MAG: DUF885 domain-containing protein [candidate division Zixibacteria bacterium]